MVGFKSFPDRIRLDFQPGLTAVVGPNGSGKSNIADAVRWVMGEMSAKSLRGGKMEDVIFSGTQFRKPLGYAEVSMTLDNASRTLPLDFDEVSVTRRVYRSGESEFAINRQPCRLRDIQMLFMDTGVGREGYSIIGQGRIDEILSVRSEDRRLLFEEAAGIMKYRVRRAEAFSKLERERQNLTRVNDLVEELAVQLEPLRQQSERAKRWLELRDAYKDVAVNIFLDEAARIRAETEKQDEALANLDSQLNGGQIRLENAREAGQALRAASFMADARLKAANEKLVGIFTETEKVGGDIRLSEARQGHEETVRRRLDGEAAKREAQEAEKYTEIAAERLTLAERTDTLAALQKQLTDRQGEFAALDDVLRAREAEIDSHNLAVMEAMTLLADGRAALREAEAGYARLETDKERVSAVLEDTAARLAGQAADVAEAAGLLEEAEAQLEHQQSLCEAYRAALAELNETRDQLAREDRAAQTALNECATRHKAIAALERHHEGYYRSVRAVLTRRDGDASLTGVHGAVGELISVPKRYELAVETALGGAAQNIVTQTEDDAKRAIEFLKDAKEGRATFLPLSAMRGRGLNTDRLRLADEAGYVGPAAELVDCDDVYRPVVGHLLGNTLVFETFDLGLRFHRKTGRQHKIVTLTGEQFSPGGAITGGSNHRSGLVGRARQLRELADDLKRLTAEAETAARALRQQEEKCAATVQMINAAQAAVQDWTLTGHNRRAALADAQNARDVLLKTQNDARRADESVMARLMDTNADIRARKRELAVQETDLAKRQADLDAYRRRVTGERGEKEEQLRALTDLRVRISQQTEMLNAQEQTVKRLIREADILKAERVALLSERAASLLETRRAQDEAEAARTRLEALQNRLSEQRAESSAIEREKTELDASQTDADADERQWSDELARLNRERDRLQLRREQLDAESRRLYDEIWDAYGLTYQTALPFKRADYSAPFLRKEEKRLKTELAGLSDVNVGAVELYETLKTRHDFLAAQYADIKKAEANLHEVVASLTRQMEERFADKFAEISRHFGDVFREMFGGGQAGLRLLDEDDILESGIEITAQPPGKSLQTLLLLSGGERALTAIALLFAILRMKPSPFCLLDEIEAALDDVNVARFARFLRQYSIETQFIIITHRRGTMETADTLYGVTMQEQGISKLVSVRLTDWPEG